MKKAFARKRKVLIIGTVFVIAIVGIIAILMVKQPNEARERAKDTEHELPAEIQSEIERLLLEPEIHITRWSVNTVEKRVDIFVYKLTPENERLNGKIIDGWTMNISEDVEFKREEEKLNAELKRLREKPEMKIAAWSYGWDPRTGYKDVDIFVDNLTPENQQLNGKTIDGWKVHVWKSLLPPEEVALQDPRVKERIEGKEYEVKEHTRKAGGDKEILVDVYIRIKEPKKTVIATVDVVKQEVIGINETSSWISIPER